MHNALRVEATPDSRKEGYMPKTPESTEAVDEAVRTISEASHRTAAYAERALTTTRAYLADAPKLFTGGASDIEAMYKAAFGLQNAVLAAMPPLMDASFAATKSGFEAYTTM